MKIRKISPPVFTTIFREVIQNEDDFTEAIIIGIKPNGEITIHSTFNKNDDTGEMLKRSLKLWESFP